MEKLSEDKYLASIIIINYNGKEETINCLKSLYGFLKGKNYEVIVVDNNSRDNSVESIKLSYPDIHILAQKQNHGFGKANNIGAQEASGKYLLFLNNDTEFTSDVLTPMIDFMENNPNIGIVGPRLQNSDGSFQLSFGKYPSLINEYKTRKQQMRCNDRLNQAKCREKEEYLKSGRVDWVSGAALMIRHSIFDQVGGYDINYFMYFEDSDLCLRAEKQGYSAYWLSEYPVIHHKGKSYTTADLKIYEEYRKSQLYYYRKNKSILEQNILRLYLLVKYSLQYLSRNKRTVARNILKNVL